jgi:PmbA protein
MEFLSIFASSLSAENVQKGKSMLEGRINEQVAATGITITDDGTLPEGIASAPADGEGIPMQRTVLIESGILKGFLYDLYTAKKDNTSSTGNGFRSGFKGTPHVGISNFYIEKGEFSQEKIISEVDEGFLIKEAMGIHTANPISGDFSLGVSGLWIKGGKVSFPVRGVVLSGNILDLFKSIEKIGADLRFFGGMGAPTLLVKEMNISGKG